MVEEGLRAVRQWLEASSQLEEGEVSRGWWAGAWQRELAEDTPLFPSASIYSRWEVEEDWCVSVLRSYQAEHGPDFPWSVGKDGVEGWEEGKDVPGRDLRASSPCAGEDMSADGRRQLALFLVSSGAG